MITQKFKGDATELAIEAAAAPAFELVSAAQDEMLAGAYHSSPFLLMLYDQGRMPFSDRVTRDVFVAFIQEALGRFKTAGTYDFYVFILKAIFGERTQILFEDPPVPGKLIMSVNAEASLEFEFEAKEFVSGAYVLSNLIDHNGDTLAFMGLSGIDSQYKLDQLFAEIIPAGLYSEVTLTFFELFSFVADEGGTISNVVDGDGNQIVFIET
jgi:hypothetical protein